MSRMIMQYGDIDSIPTSAKGIELITSGSVSDETVVELDFDAGGMYILFCSEYNASTGAYRGHRAILIQAPQESVFGTTSVKRGNMYGSSDTGIKFTYNDDSTMTLERYSSTYAFTYALYKAM